VTVQEVIETATDYLPPVSGIDLNKRQFLYPEFREALLVVGGDGGMINSRRLGTRLGRNKEKVVANLRLVLATVKDGENRWQLQAA
jgi:hypothetical protein